MAQHALAVVGAGPRGTSVLERICASAPELLPAGHSLTVHVVDPYPPGPGRVWRTDQSGELLMNTVASQVTLFTDPSVETAGPLRTGPSLWEWHEERSPGALHPDDYPPRALYGAYLEWVFAQVRHQAPPRVEVRVHGTRAVGLTGGPYRPQTLELADGTRLTGLAAVVLAQGHLPHRPCDERIRLTAHAHRHGLRYVPPGNPADLTGESEAIAPGEAVLLRGLGLNFFDHLALLTSGRGGRFTRTPSGVLRYLPSGREPRLYAGSRRGVPYHARGDNSKGARGRHEPLLLTPRRVAEFRARAAAGDPPDFRREVWPLVATEVEAVYYDALLPRPDRAAFRARFLTTRQDGAERLAVLGEFGITGTDRWDWQRLAAPHTGRVFASPADFRGWLLERLHEDVAQARLGNVHGPLKAALDVLRDLRNELRQIVDHRGLKGASRRDHLDAWYTPLNAFLSIGPPRRRVEETAALIEAGVLDVLGPGLTVACADGHFAASSPAVPGAGVAVTTLVEARLPEPDLPRTTDPLLAGLLASGEVREHTVDGYGTGGLDVTARPFHLLDASGRAHPRRFALGVPTEGVHWVTAAGARPGVNSVLLTDTDAVARAALRTVLRGLPVRVPAQGGRRTDAPTVAGLSPRDLPAGPADVPAPA